MKRRALGCLVVAVQAATLAFCGTSASTADAPGTGTGMATVKQRAATPVSGSPEKGDVRPARGGNPLWQIPLTQLSTTRDRPIFSSSRRRPPPVVAAPPPVVQPPAPKPKQPERPQLTLLGTIVNESDSLGIFMDNVAKVPVRVKVGAAYQGWTLRSVQPGTTTLEKDEETAVLAFPKPAGDLKGGATHLSAATNAKLLSLPPGAGLTGQIPAPDAPRPNAFAPAANPFMVRGDRP